MDPISLLAVGSSILQGLGSISAGYSRAGELRQEAENQRARARAIALQRVQDSESRYRELDSAMQTIAMLRGARNVGFDSPTAIAADRALARMSTENLLKSQLGFRMEADVANRNAVSLRRGARRAITAGYLNAVPSLLDAAGAMRAPGGRTQSTGGSNASR